MFKEIKKVRIGDKTHNLEDYEHYEDDWFGRLMSKYFKNDQGLWCSKSTGEIANTFLFQFVLDGDYGCMKNGVFGVEVSE